jgi:hypothetical protein
LYCRCQWGGNTDEKRESTFFRSLRNHAKRLSSWSSPETSFSGGNNPAYGFSCREQKASIWRERAASPRASTTRHASFRDLKPTEEEAEESEGSGEESSNASGSAVVAASSPICGGGWGGLGEERGGG